MGDYVTRAAKFKTLQLVKWMIFTTKADERRLRVAEGFMLAIWLKNKLSRLTEI